MKKILPILFVLVLLGAAFEGLYIWHPEWFTFLTKAPVVPLDLGETETGPAPEKHITEDAPYYEIDTAYPSATPLKKSAGATADAKAITILKSFEENEIARFKDNGNFAALTQADIEMMGYDQGRKQVLQIEYKEYLSSTAVSYVFTIYQDTLGAHGNTFFRTFVFDATTGEGLVLEDLFKPGTAYLDMLTKLSREKLKESLGELADEETIDQGTTAYEDNFQSWYLDGDALILLFPPYQVAPYAAGPQKVEIPFSELDELLK